MTMTITNSDGTFAIYNDSNPEVGTGLGDTDKTGIREGEYMMFNGRERCVFCHSELEWFGWQIHVIQ